MADIDIISIQRSELLVLSLSAGRQDDRLVRGFHTCQTPNFDFWRTHAAITRAARAILAQE
jgi:hypothetical protein